MMMLLGLRGGNKLGLGWVKGVDEGSGFMVESGGMTVYFKESGIVNCYGLCHEYGQREC